MTEAELTQKLKDAISHVQASLRVADEAGDTPLTRTMLKTALREGQDAIALKQEWSV